MEVIENGGKLETDLRASDDAFWQLEPSEPRQGAASLCLGKLLEGDLGLGRKCMI